MTKKTENARPTVGAVERAVETGAVCKAATTSTKNDTTDGADRQPFRIADLLHPGSESAISRRQLMSLTGLRDRELRLLIEAERRRGVPILSDNVHGYFYQGTRRSVTAASAVSAAGLGRSWRQQQRLSKRRYRCGRKTVLLVKAER